MLTGTELQVSGSIKKQGSNSTTFGIQILQDKCQYLKKQKQKQRRGWGA